eukprot:TRINITY_DN13588_c0_g1_i1.p1 TRINITY_DN13588_c0_g1~~TRINITY_DN13588_c0_g1_i1.p1  ORF type:complete len:576 (-),score=27.82 TRINITY_DN13588_c0_g1_i1:37-1764(-)
MNKTNSFGPMEGKSRSSIRALLSWTTGIIATCAALLFSLLFVFPVTPHWHVRTHIPDIIEATDYVWMVWMACISISHVVLSISDPNRAPAAPSRGSREARTRFLPTYSVKTWIGLGVCLSLVLLWVAGPTIYLQLDKPKFNLDKRLTGLGKALGWAPTWCMAVAILLAFKKTPYSSLLFGSEYSAGITWHSLLGHSATVFSCLHGIAFFVKYLLKGRKMLYKKLLPTSWQGVTNFLGITAFVILVAMSLLSLPSLRRRVFRLFFYTHIFGFLLVIVCCVLHYDPAAYTFVPVLVGYLADRYRNDLHAVPGRTRCSRLSSHLLHLEIPAPASLGSWTDGQHVQVRIPSLRLAEWHPFSIVTAPPAQSVSVIIKVENDWTRLLGEKCRHGPIELEDGVVEINGYFGSRKCPTSEYDSILILCGGVGAVCALSYLRSISSLRESTQVFLISSFRSEADARAFSPLFSCVNNIPNLARFRTHITRAEREDSVLSDFDGSPVLLERRAASAKASQGPTSAPWIAFYTLLCHLVAFVSFYLSRKYFSMGLIYHCPTHFEMNHLGLLGCWFAHRLVPLIFPV